MAKKTYIKAITEGIDIALAEDPKTLVFGEDVGLLTACKKSTARIGSSVPHLLNLVS